MRTHCRRCKENILPAGRSTCCASCEKELTGIIADCRAKYKDAPKPFHIPTHRRKESHGKGGRVSDS